MEKLPETINLQYANGAKMKLCAVSDKPAPVENGCGCSKKNDGMPDINISIQNNSSADTGQRSLTSPNYAPNYAPYYAPATNTALRTSNFPYTNFPTVQTAPIVSPAVERVPIQPQATIVPVREYVTSPPPPVQVAPLEEETCKREFIPLWEWF